MQSLNLNYFKDLSQGDKSVERYMIDLFKQSLLEEKEVYLKMYDDKNFVAAAEILHRVKSKFKILQDEIAFEEVEVYEKSLKQMDSDELSHKNFVNKMEEILFYLNENNYE